MLLHDFISTHRDEILETCRRRLCASVAESEAANDDVKVFSKKCIARSNATRVHPY